MSKVNLSIISGWIGLEQGAELYGSSVRRFSDAVHRQEVLGAHRVFKTIYSDGRLFRWCGYPGGIAGPVASEQTVILPKNTLGIQGITVLSGLVSGCVILKEFVPGQGEQFAKARLESLPLSGVMGQIRILTLAYDEDNEPYLREL